jgi:MYXO-CTERM domain-containing protein
MRHTTRVAAGAAFFGSLVVGSSTSSAALVARAIYSNIPGHATAQVPGLPGREIATLGSPYASGDFSRWVFRGLTTETTARDFVVLTDGSGGQLVAKNGTAVPGVAGQNFGTIDVECDVNNAGHVALGFNTVPQGGSGNTKNVGRFDGTGVNLVARQGTASSQVPGATYAGGANLGDAQITTDGRVGFRAAGLVGVPSGTEQAIILGDAVLARKGQTVPSNQSGGQTTPYGGATASQGFNSRYTHVNASGSNFVTGAKVARVDIGGTNEVFVLVNNNVVQLEEDQQLPGAPAGQILSELNCYPNIAANGDALVRCFSRGAGGPFSVDVHHFYINDAHVAGRGDLVPGGAAGERFANTLDTSVNVFASAAGNSLGDVAFTAGTDHPNLNRNQVLILRDAAGSAGVVMREGDGVDLDGDALPDAFIHAFGSPAIDGSYFAPTSFIGDDLSMLMKVELRTESDPTAGVTVLGQAFISVQIPEPGAGVMAVLILAGATLRRRRRRV